MTRRQTGFSIVAAIFLVVVIALIAGFLASIGAVQQTSSAYSLVAIRAHYAAMSAVEWGAHQVLANPLAPACPAAVTSFSVPGPGAGGFTVTVVCTEFPVTEGADSYSVFDLEVEASTGTSGQEDYFRRIVSASVATGP